MELNETAQTCPAGSVGLCARAGLLDIFNTAVVSQDAFRRLEDLDFQRRQSGGLYAAWRADPRQPFAGVAKVLEMPDPLFGGDRGAGIIANAESARQF